MNKSKYINRDLSWLEFNRRVLEEAQDTSTPLLERVKFLSIVSSNLDEFMSVRVAGIKELIKASYSKKDFSGYTPQALFKKIMKRTDRLVSQQYRTYRELSRMLMKEGVVFASVQQLNPQQKQAVDQYFHDLIFPVLTPMAFDQSHPFPLVHNQNIYLAVLLRKEEEQSTEEQPYFAIVQVPSNLRRYISITSPQNSKKQEFVLLEDLIKEHIHTLFSGYAPVAVNEFRLTRNSDLILNEEGAEDLLEELEKELRKRRWGAPVRLEIEDDFHPYSLQLLKEEFEIVDENVCQIDGPLDLSFFMKFVTDLPGYGHLRYKPIEPIYPNEFADNDDFFSVLRQKDVLVYHPYESFDAVNDFLFQAADDPTVLAIKMMLYRVSGNSPIIRSLARAAEEGKQVTVVVEIKARFDEERNIAWARQLEKAGCHVVYGLVGLKTHAKTTLIVRQEQQVLRRYVHVGTGNYNNNTAMLYTDIGLFTSHPLIGEDASAFFNEITGYSVPHDWQAFGVAPTDLKSKLFQFIEREAEFAAQGKPARIIAKMNAVSNQEMIDKLYTASQAGVKIDLIVRGICSLRPGVTGLSENISVRSIVDRFLEHSRIYYFENGGDPEVWISSADWMTRNLNRRVELMAPVYNRGLRDILIQILNLSLSDNVKARKLLPSGEYHFVRNDLLPFRSQFEAQDIITWKSYRRL